MESISYSVTSDKPHQSWWNLVGVTYMGWRGRHLAQCSMYSTGTVSCFGSSGEREKKKVPKATNQPLHWRPQQNLTAVIFRAAHLSPIGISNLSILQASTTDRDKKIPSIHIFGIKGPPPAKKVLERIVVKRRILRLLLTHTQKLTQNANQTQSTQRWCRLLWSNLCYWWLALLLSHLSKRRMVAL